MNSSTVIDKISDLNYKGFKEAYIRQMENVNYHQLSFDERVYDLQKTETFEHSFRKHLNSVYTFI